MAADTFFVGSSSLDASVDFTTESTDLRLRFGCYAAANNWWFAVNDVLITVDVLLGDVNLDGVVNLRDVEPVVDRICSGSFQAEADINEDDDVNLLDVGLFVQLLSGN